MSNKPISFKRCCNCKFRKSQDYGRDLCKNPKFFRIEKDSNGMTTKVTSYCEDVYPRYGICDVPCEHFEEDLWFKIMKFKDRFVAAYYKKRHPEWFL